MEKGLPMPDISDLNLLKEPLLVILIGLNDKGLTKKLGLHRRNFIRLVDKAIIEYLDARQELVKEIKEEKRTLAGQNSGQVYRFAFIDHLENCVNAVRRLLGILERLKTDTTSNVFPRETRKLLQSIGKDIIDVRDVIEHMDEKVQDDQIGANEPVMLSLSRERDTVMIGDYFLRLSQLSITIRRLHQVGLNLLELSPKS